MIMIPVFTLPPLGQGIELLLIAALSCWLLRISFWRWCRWMALPFDFLTVGVVTILFNINRGPQMLLASISVGSYWLGISAPGMVTANETFWRSLAVLVVAFWLALDLSFPQLIILLKHAHVLRLLTKQILLTWQFIFILLDGALAIHRVQTLCFGYRGLPLGYRSLAVLVRLLFIRVLIRYQ